MLINRDLSVKYAQHYDLLCIFMHIFLIFFYIYVQLHKSIEVGGLYCSQSIIKRWFYVLCDFCCEPLDIIKVQGVHFPLEKKEPSFSISKLSSTISTMTLNESKYSSTLDMSNVSTNKSIEFT